MTEHEFWCRVDNCKERLWRLGRMWLGSDWAAVDVLDEAVLRAYTALPKLRQPEYFETWLTRILINECKRELKRRRREQAAEHLPEQVAEEGETLPLRQAIQALPDGLREVVLLRYFDGRTLEECGKILNIPRSTVHAREKKALKLLKLELSEEG